MTEEQKKAIEKASKQANFKFNHPVLFHLRAAWRALWDRKGQKYLCLTKIDETPGLVWTDERFT